MHRWLIVALWVVAGCSTPPRDIEQAPSPLIDSRASSVAVPLFLDAAIGTGDGTVLVILQNGSAVLLADEPAGKPQLSWPAGTFSAAERRALIDRAVDAPQSLRGEQVNVRMIGPTGREEQRRFVELSGPLRQRIDSALVGALPGSSPFVPLDADRPATQPNTLFSPVTATRMLGRVDLPLLVYADIWHEQRSLKVKSDGSCLTTIGPMFTGREPSGGPDTIPIVDRRKVVELASKSSTAVGDTSLSASYLDESGRLAQRSVRVARSELPDTVTRQLARNAN